MAEVLYESHPAMFRNRPFAFALCVLLIPAFGLGLVILLIWWVKCLGATLTVTDRTTTQRTGILSKSTSEVDHDTVRNIQISQTFFQRLFDVGSIGISSAGQSGIEILVDGIPHPEKVRDLINAHRHQA